MAAIITQVIEIVNTKVIHSGDEMTCMETIGQRLKRLRESRGLSQGALASQAGLKSQGTIGNIERETRGYGDSVVDIARVLGVTPDYLRCNESDETSVALPVTALTPSPSPGMSVVHVPLLANSGSMGPGTDIQHDDILVGQIALSEQWVSRRLQPTHLNALRFIHAYGDSMSPTFEDGDILLVDTGIRDPKIIDGVYVMAANDRVYIKRVRQRMDGVVEISSDNATVKTVDVLNGDHRIDILGRVVWCWNGRKL